MNRKTKLLAIILSLILCLSVISAVTAYAVGEEESGETPVSEPASYDPPPESETVTEAPVTKAPTEAPTKAPTQAPVTRDTEAPATTAPATTAAPTDPQTQAPNNNDYYYENTESLEQRESNTSNEKADTAAVYDAEDDDVSTDTLKKGDWAKIASQLKDANGDDTDDFAFIRNNDASGGNNGEWMLILGIAMEAVGLGIVIWMIVMKVRSKKAIANGHFNGSNNERGSARPAPVSDRPQPQRRDDVGKVKRSKFDTADVVIPKHAQKPNNNRYKPKH